MVNSLEELCVASHLLALCYARCGRVMNVTIARDLQGKPIGYAHVEFSNELEAQNALSLSGTLIRQHPARLTYCSPSLYA